MPVLNLRLCQRRMSVSSTVRLWLSLRLSKYWRPINQERGVMRSKDKRGRSEEREFRDWEKNRMRTKE